MVLKTIKNWTAAGVSRLRNANSTSQKKVFAVGFNKTATSSIHDLFKTLGLKSFHGPKWRACDDLQLLKSYDCFSDGIPKDLPKLDRLFPGSKFILQVRDLDSWIYSRLSHIERNKATGNYNAGDKWDNSENAIKSWITGRNFHHLHVLSYFEKRPLDLLVINFIRDESAAKKIADFIGLKGNLQKPMKNVNPKKERLPKHIEMLNACVSDLNISDQELKYDIYCPSILESTDPQGFPCDTSKLELKIE